VGRLSASIVLLAALASAGCASSQCRSFGSAAASAERARPHPGARAGFAPPKFEEVFAAAVDLVHDRGLEIAECQEWRGALTTVPVEIDARCGGSTCLARDTTRVKLGYRRARVVVTREVWDAAIRGWREQVDPGTEEELSRTERELVSGMVLRGAAAPDDAADRANPCALPRCRAGTCVAASGAPRR
jgi:hypothetical protein